MTIDQEHEIEHARRLRDWLTSGETDWRNDSDTELAKQASERFHFMVTRQQIAEMRIRLGLQRATTCDNVTPSQFRDIVTPAQIRRRCRGINRKWTPARERQARGISSTQYREGYRIPLVAISDLGLEPKRNGNAHWAETSAADEKRKDH
jgi:hypothetical protein